MNLSKRNSKFLLEELDRLKSEIERFENNEDVYATEYLRNKLSYNAIDACLQIVGELTTNKNDELANNPLVMAISEHVKECLIL